jgi:hypothetical protein
MLVTRPAKSPVLRKYSARRDLRNESRGDRLEPVLVMEAGEKEEVLGCETAVRGAGQRQQNGTDHEGEGARYESSVPVEE